jgi:hypothetical protein
VIKKEHTGGLDYAGRKQINWFSWTNRQRANGQRIEESFSALKSVDASESSLWTHLYRSSMAMYLAVTESCSGLIKVLFRSTLFAQLARHLLSIDAATKHQK